MIRLKYKNLDLGCGIKKLENYIGIDIGDFDYPKGEFIKGDVFEVLEQIDKGTIEQIYSNQFIEHIPKDKFIGFMNSCYRVLKEDGLFECIFPPAIRQDGMPNGEYYADPTHVNAMLPGTFACFSRKYRDKVYKELGTDYRGYGIETDLDITKVSFINSSQVQVELVKRI